jgi:PadR family transcriptional regulator AphA
MIKREDPPLAPGPPPFPGPPPSPGSVLAPGDYVFMALLGLGPMSAYDVKKAMATSVNFFWTAAHSQQARRLVRDGYVEETGPGNARGRRTLSLTASGREALAAWLRSPAPLVRSYDEATAKLFFGDQSDLPSLIAMLEDQARQHGELLGSYLGMAMALSGWDPGGAPPYPLLTLQLGIKVEQAFMEWLADTLADLRRREAEQRREAE